MWKIRNYTGTKDVLLYEEREYEELEEKLAKYKEILYNVYKASNNCSPYCCRLDTMLDEETLEEFAKRREEEWNARNAGLTKE